ncbi:DUF6550 family protein [Anaerocolumna xylanovorans]|uniref:Uncharacterized protein n=1 Tax=Anaerocolumna xylanovorans DSM 12503 TaxID=1121345 RepID=A0A1M7Y0N3_9FIRM|nr:DUF6550 family protein [Anaerocolumna xylanovorans]SHO45234.1 hypothetical protein SAMN02745217_00884 [Anaerocolumna xylanovorans DSM 12503]
MNIIKLKKTVTSKPFIAGTLAVLCVGILAVCLIPRGTEKTEFVPEPTPTITQAESWNEDTAAKEAQEPTVTVSPVPTSKAVEKSDTKADYPKTVESDENQTVVEFTDPSPVQPEEPAVPEGKTKVKASSSDTAHKDPTVTPSKQKASQSDTPVPGSKNEKGQVYDAAFGWITIEEGVGIPTDNDGDPDKQIGSMD